jgi:hypothetical protein
LQCAAHVRREGNRKLLIRGRDRDISEHIVQCVECDETADYSTIAQICHERWSVLAEIEATRCNVAEASIDEVIEPVERVHDFEAVLGDVDAVHDGLDSPTNKVSWSDRNERDVVDGRQCKYLWIVRAGARVTSYSGVVLQEERDETCGRDGYEKSKDVRKEVAAKNRETLLDEDESLLEHGCTAAFAHGWRFYSLRVMVRWHISFGFVVRVNDTESLVAVGLHEVVLFHFLSISEEDIL